MDLVAPVLIRFRRKASRVDSEKGEASGSENGVGGGRRAEQPRASFVLSSELSRV